MVEREPQLDRVYRALADPTRRQLLTVLGSGDARIKDLADPLPISFAAVARHVATLEQAQLISRDVRGREHWLSVNVQGLRDAEAWIAEQSAAWSARADALAGYLRRTQH
ncbi:MAG TPA: metalloregulator ArsR/SmtB family transcription factor [Solirubrobacteraceae bacterium]|jgi:DNA-binding transcriptional ArsR family regulator|nr:metalloregulator ArsR/SmtB family transcription factor [Solirubrobacteraceae bacterium]